MIQIIWYFCNPHLKQTVWDENLLTEKTATIWATSWQNQQNDCVPSEDSDQPGHLISLPCVLNR